MYFCTVQVFAQDSLYNSYGIPIILLMEIRGAQVEVGSLSHCLQGFIYLRWLFGISSIHSTIYFNL